MRVLLTTIHSKYIHASLALPYLQSFCQAEIPDIHIREFSVHQPKEIVLAEVMDLDPEVICFSVYLWNRLATLELAAAVKAVNPAVKVALGGPEVSFEDDEFCYRHQVDALIRGEGELPLKRLLTDWQNNGSPKSGNGLQLPGGLVSTEGCRHTSHLKDLDRLPSPFAAGLVDLSRRLVYYESSRGCPYNCSFCMSSLEQDVRTFSRERIQSDLRILLEHKVPLIKFVDRTFNYDNSRARDIFTFLLENNRGSRFHFEIGAHLLDEATLNLLKDVPPGVFQFEIGVQSTLPETLEKVSRKASLEKLEENIRWLKNQTEIHLHLDLIAGLPGERLEHFLGSIDRTLSLGADHLQIEPVKLLPGAPLRKEAAKWGIRFDPYPPYTILSSYDISYKELEILRGIGRLLDLLVNSGRFTHLLGRLHEHFGSAAEVLRTVDGFWRRRGLYRDSMSLRSLYLELNNFLEDAFSGHQYQLFRECLGRDYANNERVVSGSAPEFFDTDISEEENIVIRQRVKLEVDRLPRHGKIQYFAAAFHWQPDFSGRTILIFLYNIKTSEGVQVLEIPLNGN